MSSIRIVAVMAVAPHTGAMPKASAPKKAAPKKRAPPPGTRQALFYLPDGMLDALDAWAEKLTAKSTGPAWSRSDVVKAALQRALAERGEKGEAP